MSRQTKFKEEYCRSLIDSMSKGNSMPEWAIENKIPCRCAYDWVEKFESFRNAKKEGDEKFEAWYTEIVKIGMRNGKNDEYPNGVNLGFVAWFGKNKLPKRWSDNVKTENVNSNVNLDVTRMAPAEREKRIQELLQERDT